MGRGTLIVAATAAEGALPVAGASVIVQSREGAVLAEMTTDGSGNTAHLALSAADAYHTFDPNDPGPYYTGYDVMVSAPGYESVIVRNVHVFDGDETILPVNMTPQLAGAPATGRALEVAGAPVQEIVLDDNDLHSTAPRNQDGPPEPAVQPRVLSEVVIPDFITVHLGRPQDSATNVRVAFKDYIKNVASNEIYSTWPVASLEANVWAIISYTLNRVFTEWYPSRGYAFHITNSTSYDQKYVHGSAVYARIVEVVDRLFNTYIRRQGHQEPYFAAFCNGTTVTCDGLSQWGSYYLANQGQGSEAILRNYYPSDIQIITSSNIGGVPQSYPGYVLRQGSVGEPVQRIQTYLNRIRVNYPLIPSIANPGGVFGSDTAAAVRTYQGVAGLTQNGEVNQATWYSIVQRYVAVTKLGELASEGIRIGIGSTPPTSVLRQGASGRDVVQLQFLLNVIAEFYPAVPMVLQNSTFDAATRDAVLAFQRQFGLSADGVVGPGTWNKLYEVYHSIEQNVKPPSVTTPVYPGVLLRLDSRGEDVRLMQQYLNVIATARPTLPRLGEDGIFGTITQGAVREFQRLMGLGQDGIIGPATWNAIVGEYQRVSAGGGSGPAYPGTLLREGSRGEDVRVMQGYLNAISTAYPAVLGGLGVDGIFGERTRAAVLSFQREFGLVTDGVIGPATWARIVQAYGTV